MSYLTLAETATFMRFADALPFVLSLKKDM